TGFDRMRRCCHLMLLAAALALAGCAHAPPRMVRAVPAPLSAPVAQPSLDALVYSQPAPSCVKPCAAPVAPVVAAPIAVPAFAPVEPASYTLDSGDKLRVVVFGQDTLSNTYTVDAAGSVTMPLIGAVPARGL